MLLEHGALVTIISSSPDKVDAAVKQLNSPQVSGEVGNVRDEQSYTDLLRKLAPVDHIIYSGVDTIIRSAIADADLEQAKDRFEVKFWGSAVTGKSKPFVKYIQGILLSFPQLLRNTTL